MLTLAQLREAAGGPDGLTDEEIVQATHPLYQRYYPSMDDYAGAIGYAGAGRGKNASRMSSAVDTYQANLYGVAEATAKKAGLPDSVASWGRTNRESNESAAGYANARAKELGAVDDWRDIAGPRDAADYVTGLAINTAPQMGAMATGAAVGGLVTRNPFGAMAGAAAVGYPSNVGQILQEQREQNGQMDILSAGALAVPYTAIDTLTGAGGMVSRVAGGQMRKAAAGGLAKRVAKGVATGAVEEGAGELAQTGLEQVGRMAVDPSETFLNEGSAKRMVDATVGGAALGGVFGGAGGVRRAKPAASDTTAPVDDTPGASTDILALTDDRARGPNAAGVGQVHVFPDGSTATDADMQTMRDHGKLPGQLDEERRLAAAQMPAAGVPVQDQINAATGVGQRVTPPNYQQQAEAAFNEPTGQRVSTAPNQLEQDQTAGDALASQTGEHDNQLRQKLEIEAAAKEFAGRKKMAHDDLVDPDANGQPMIQLKPTEVALHHDMVTMRASGALTQEQFTSLAGGLKEALRSNDRKAIGAVRKALEEIKNPKPVAPVVKPAEPLPEAKTAPIAAEKATPAPKKTTLATETAAGESPTPAPKPEEAPVAAPAPAPVATPTATGYAAYEGRSVAVEVAVEGRKPMRRVLKNARVALEEADDRISKFEELARCLGHE